MDELRLEHVLREFPGFRPERYFEAALERIRLRITATVLVRRNFPIIGQFMLRAVDLGYRTAVAIAHLLGVEERDLAGAGALLISSGMLRSSQVSEHGHREYELTPLGRSALDGTANLAVPQRRILEFHYAPLTRHLLPREQAVRQAREIRDQGIFVVSATESTMPSLGDITVQDVRHAIEAGSDYGDIDVLQLLELSSPFIEYLPGTIVFLLRHRETGDERMVAYRGVHLLPVESQALDEAYHAGTLHLPSDVSAIDDGSWVATSGLSTDTAGAVAHALTINRHVQELELDLSARTSTEGAAGTGRERLDYEDEVRRLADELSRAQRERDAATQQLQAAHDTELIVTENHRKVLDTALRQAQREVIIISPWMNLRAVDHDLVDLMKSATERGVFISIGYGISEQRGTAEEDRNRQSANAVKQRIQRRVGEHAWRIQIIEVGNTHEKILVCDRSFAVTGSFNWLSYRGAIDAGYRRETSVLVRDEHTVEKIAARALEALDSGRRRKP